MKKFLFLASIFFSTIIYGNDYLETPKNQHSQSIYGGVGLITMPTARFDDDGELLVGVSTETPFNRLFANLLPPFTTLVILFIETSLSFKSVLFI